MLRPERDVRLTRLTSAQQDGADSVESAASAARTATYTVTYAPSYKQAHTLAKVAEFDRRLALLEKVLGVPATAAQTAATSLGAVDAPLPAAAILPLLEQLSRQMAVLSGSTTSSLDAASRRVKQLTADTQKLTADTQKLTEARQAARAADASGAGGGSGGGTGGGNGGGNGASTGASNGGLSEEMAAKISALHGVLPTIEGMRPLLPALLDRLRSLRAIHQDAAHASDTLARLEARQDELAAEMQTWEDTLVKVEAIVVDSRGTIQGNMATVEGWVREIERKMELAK